MYLYEAIADARAHLPSLILFQIIEAIGGVSICSPELMQCVSPSSYATYTSVTDVILLSSDVNGATTLASASLNAIPT
jgi:hypothetical protein